MAGLSQPRVRFMRWIFGAWLGLPVRHTMSNLARFGPYCDKSIRIHMERYFDFADFCQRLIAQSCERGSERGSERERIAAFDPTFVSKAGRHTYGVDSWWCGTAQRVLRGLELGVLGVIDVSARSAFNLQSTQTPPLQTLRQEGKSLMEHYVGLITEQAPRLLSLGVKMVAADAYFAKKSFIDPLVANGFGVVTRLRQDANLRYLYHGPQKRTGRPKKYDGKVDCQHIDKRRLRLFAQDEKCRYYSGVVYAVALKRCVRIVYIEQNQGKRYCILMSSEVALAPQKIVEYYRLRFQIEFLIRDAKTFAGLEECQARDQNKLDFHFNMALTCVSLAKAAFWLTQPPGQSAQRDAFSMRNIQLLFTNQLWTERVFQNLGLDLSLNKHQTSYERCLDIGQWAV